MDRFLAGVERRAYQMARVSTGDPDAALDIVQDAMYRLVKSYQHKSADDWPPLFYRILNNAITDWHRQRSRGWKVFDRWFGADDTVDPVNTAPAPVSLQPERQVQTNESLQQLETALQELPPRQQQAFMLRCWEGLSTRDTATAMGCSEGTVKTLYSRALHRLREQLEHPDA
ncbi:MAG: RNA polymerase sigma factor [Gammaproteobacteria bacterium]|nr:RNA polymerase sigma factor [Gammaproteobacteria bacterium]NND55379.1 RNA polymerase sigma factor [Gammaproteobacteria bacterium]